MCLLSTAAVKGTMASTGGHVLGPAPHKALTPTPRVTDEETEFAPAFLTTPKPVLLKATPTSLVSFWRPVPQEDTAPCMCLEPAFPSVALSIHPLYPSGSDGAPLLQPSVAGALSSPSSSSLDFELPGESTGGPEGHPALVRCPHCQCSLVWGPCTDRHPVKGLDLHLFCPQPLAW